MSGLSRKDIEEILELLDGSHFDSLKLEMGEMRLEANRRGTGRPAPTVSEAARSPAGNPPQPERQSAPAHGVEAPAAGAVGEPVTAPLLGTFYRAPKPGAEPFVKVGDKVTADTVIGILEVMKLMNSVTAGIEGTVCEIVAKDGDLVEFGQCLIRVVRD